MESWFLADRGTLKTFYGPGFHEESLPSDPSIERIAKADVLDGLARATRKTSKGPYDKGPTSFDILAEVDPSEVERSARHAKRFLDSCVPGARGEGGRMRIHGIEYGHEHERLEHLLRSVDRPGEYCVGGRLYTPLPRVVVEGAGELSFPVPGSQIRSLIAAAERAPYGRGTETVVDPSVRDCWQIDATRVRLTGRAWPHSFRKVVDLVASGLGLPAERLGAELYKLLVYRRGGFFAEHRDTEKAPGMVATLSLSMPARGAGGELVVRHREKEKVFDLNAGEPSELSYAAFYADCPHEVRPLVEGHRVTLVFNLFLDSDGDAPGAPDYSDLAAPVASEPRVGLGRGWDDYGEEDGSDTEMDEVHDRWEALDGTLRTLSIGLCSRDTQLGGFS